MTVNIFVNFTIQSTHLLFQDTYAYILTHSKQQHTFKTTTHIQNNNTHSKQQHTFKTTTHIQNNIC